MKNITKILLTVRTKKWLFKCKHSLNIRFSHEKSTEKTQRKVKAHDCLHKNCSHLFIAKHVLSLSLNFFHKKMTLLLRIWVKWQKESYCMKNSPRDQKQLKFAKIIAQNGSGQKSYNCSCELFSAIMSHFFLQWIGFFHLVVRL